MSVIGFVSYSCFQRIPSFLYSLHCLAGIISFFFNVDMNIDIFSNLIQKMCVGTHIMIVLFHHSDYKKNAFSKVFNQPI